jgi:hypothetical protein
VGQAIIRALGAALLLSTALTSSATWLLKVHGGGLNASGCHFNRKIGNATAISRALVVVSVNRPFAASREKSLRRLRIAPRSKTPLQG